MAHVIPSQMIANAGEFMKDNQIHEICRFMEKEESLPEKESKMQKLTKKEQARKESKLLSLQWPIKPKMFSKLAKWMDKICREILNFSSQTFQIATQILINYLELENVTPNQFQLVGCVCLHLASKVNESTIVAIQSYIDCSLGIFTKESFIEKEEKIFEKLNFTISNGQSLHQKIFSLAFKFLKYQLNQNEERNLCSLAKEVMKNLDFTAHSYDNIAEAIIFLHIQDQKQQNLVEKLLEILNTRVVIKLDQIISSRN